MTTDNDLERAAREYAERLWLPNARDASEHDIEDLRQLSKVDMQNSEVDFLAGAAFERSRGVEVWVLTKHGKPVALDDDEQKLRTYIGDSKALQDMFIRHEGYDVVKGRLLMEPTE